MIVLFRSALGIVLAALAMLAYLVWDNNRDVNPPTQAEIKASLERAIRWVESDRDRLLKTNNYILWWMVDRSAQLTGDATLQDISARARQRHFDPRPELFWRSLFDAYEKVDVPDPQPKGWHDYHAYLAYGLTCDRQLGESERVMKQQAADFCLLNQPFSPACVTHQLMAVRFARENGCDEPHQLDELTAALQDSIVTLLTYDPRLVDVYIQRLLMLADTGAAARIKPVWLRRMLDAQLPNGSWGDCQSLIAFGASTHWCFSSTIFSFAPLKSDLHVSAQAILLLSLLMNQTDTATWEQSKPLAPENI